MPLNEKEVRHYAKDLKPVLDENWAMVAEKRTPARSSAPPSPSPTSTRYSPNSTGGYCHSAGSPPSGSARRSTPYACSRSASSPSTRHTGVAARFYQMHFDAAERTPQKGGEMGWILETNTPMNRAMEGMGGQIKRRYRVYERTI